MMDASCEMERTWTGTRVRQPAKARHGYRPEQIMGRAALYQHGVLGAIECWGWSWKPPTNRPTGLTLIEVIARHQWLLLLLLLPLLLFLLDPSAISTSSTSSTSKQYEHMSRYPCTCRIPVLTVRYLDLGPVFGYLGGNAWGRQSTRHMDTAGSTYMHGIGETWHSNDEMTVQMRGETSHD